MIYSNSNKSTYTAIALLKTSALIWPIMTLFYITRGLSFLEIGLLNSIGSIIIAILEIPLGYLSDRVGHRLCVVFGLFLHTLFVAILLLAHDFWLFVLSECVFSIGTCLISGAHTALLYDSLRETGSEKDYHHYISKLSSAIFLVGAPFSLLAPALYTFSADLPFWITLALYAVIFAVSLRYRTPHPPKLDEPQPPQGITSRVASSQSLLSKIKGMLHLTLARMRQAAISLPAFWVFALLSTFLVFAASNLSVYQAPFLEGLGLPLALFGVVYFAKDMISALGSWCSDKIISVKWGYSLFVVMLLIAALAMVCGFVGTLYVAIPVMLLIRFLEAILSPALNARINQTVKSEYRATMLSISSSLDNLIFFITDPLIGLVMDHYGVSLGYVAVGATLVLATVVLGLWSFGRI